MLEVGPDNVTLREVARRADFSPAAIYTYFANRDAIILALMEDSFRRLDEYVRRVPRNSSPDRRVIEFCLAYMDFGREIRPTYAASWLPTPSTCLRGGTPRWAWRPPGLSERRSERACSKGFSAHEG